MVSDATCNLCTIMAAGNFYAKSTAVPGNLPSSSIWLNTAWRTQARDPFSALFAIKISDSGESCRSTWRDVAKVSKGVNCNQWTRHLPLLNPHPHSTLHRPHRKKKVKVILNLTIIAKKMKIPTKTNMTINLQWWMRSRHNKKKTNIKKTQLEIISQKVPQTHPAITNLLNKVKNTNNHHRTTFTPKYSKPSLLQSTICCLARCREDFPLKSEGITQPLDFYHYTM